MRLGREYAVKEKEAVVMAIFGSVDDEDGRCDR
jgi:hypothetical protein